MSRIHFHFLTLFPESMEPYLKSSILGAAEQKKIISITMHNFRAFGLGSHKKVDGHPYGGGAGMVLMVEPLVRAVSNITSKIKHKKTKVVILSPKGKQFNQRIAHDWSKKYQDIIFVSGRYEGIDERVKKILKAEEISIGPYVLTDGDIAALVMTSAIARLVPGVIKLKSLAEESHWNLLVKKEAHGGKDSGLEYPHYTRPEVFTWKGRRYKVPKVLLSGNHKKIKEWRDIHIYRSA